MSARKLNFASAANPFAQQAKIPPSDLLPLVPPGASIAEGSTVKPFQLGKIPGRYAGGQWWGLGGHWPTMGLSKADQTKAQNWPTENVGLRAADFPAIDCDVQSEEAFQLVEAVVARTMGFAPVRKRPNAPRALYVFKRSGEDAVRKMRTVFTDGVAEHAVEVLGAGQQYVISGMHPTKVLYNWMEGRELVKVGVDGLTPHDATGFARFMDALRQEIEARGWLVKSQTQARAVSGGVEFPVTTMDPVIEPELVLAALDAIPNTEEHFSDRGKFVAILASFKAALGRDAEQHKEAFYAWANKHGYAAEEWVDGIWPTITSTRTGPEHLFAEARKFGFIGDALADFGEPVLVSDTNSGEPETEDDVQKDVASKLVYWTSACLFIHLQTGEELSHQALNSYHGLGTRLAPAGTSGTKSAANKLINSGLVSQVRGKTYLPAQPTLTTWDNGMVSGLFYNRWKAGVHWSLPESVTDQDVTPWLAHMEFLFPDGTERGAMLDYLAHVVQRRGVKVRWAPLIISKQGLGKGVMMKPLSSFLGSNFKDLEPAELARQFNGHWEHELVVVEEMQRMDRIDAYEKLKAIITGTASNLLTIERKFQEPYAIPNVVNVMFFSNHLDAISMARDDRRFLVLTIPHDKRDPSYYTKIVNWYDTEDGKQKVIQWLMQRDISAFDPNAEPMMTAAKQEVIDNAMPFYHDELRSQLGKDGVFGKFSVLTPGDVVAEAQSNHNLPLHFRQTMTTKAKAFRALEAAGWFNAPKQVRVDGEIVRFWVRDRAMLDADPANLREQYKRERA